VCIFLATNRDRPTCDEGDMMKNRLYPLPYLRRCGNKHESVNYRKMGPMFGGMIILTNATYFDIIQWELP
jgi:hypothetical protein